VSNNRIVSEAEQIARDYQGISNGGVTIPSWLFFLGLGIFGGMIVGPALMSTTAAGSAKLAELSRRKVGG